MKVDSRETRKIQAASKIALLLDYDGTLADFAPTPDDVFPDPALIALIRALAASPKIWVAIISGRRLSHIEKLVPVDGIWLAGSYGLEMRAPTGEKIEPIRFEQVRPVLEKLKPAWENLLAAKTGFYLEDKGWSLAIHARFAEDAVAAKVLLEARSVARRMGLDSKFDLLGGHKFLELAPQAADKGKTVAYLLEQIPTENVLPIYLGDDDKDERAFPVVHQRDGLTGYVGHQNPNPEADFHLEDPQSTRHWLNQLLQTVSANQ